MNIPSEFNGHVTFFWSLKFNFLTVSNHDDMGDDWLKLSDPIHVSCAFYDVRKEQIAALEKKIEKEQAESLHRINVMRGQIQELRAIEAK